MNIKIALAPMAGVADRAFRRLSREFGADWTVSELISAKGASLGDKKSAAMMDIVEQERPTAIQLFGAEPQSMAIAAKMAAEKNPEFIDINMGCPAPKVAGQGGGSSLMGDPKRAGEIIRAVVAAVELPITVKIRSGLDSDHINAVEIAKIAEDSGARAIAVHGRTKQQMYAPPVDLSIIADVKKAVSIPVIGNGDIDSPEAAKRMLEATGCDHIMIGRAAMGSPWLFSQVKEYLESGSYKAAPTLAERMAILRRQAEYMQLYRPERNAMLELRKHAAWYMKGLNSAAELRRKAAEINTLSDLERLIDLALEKNV